MIVYISVRNQKRSFAGHKQVVRRVFVSRASFFVLLCRRLCQPVIVRYPPLKGCEREATKTKRNVKRVIGFYLNTQRLE